MVVALFSFGEAPPCKLAAPPRPLSPRASPGSPDRARGDSLAPLPQKLPVPSTRVCPCRHAASRATRVMKLGVATQLACELAPHALVGTFCARRAGARVAHRSLTLALVDVALSECDPAFACSATPRAARTGQGCVDHRRQPGPGRGARAAPGVLGPGSSEAGARACSQGLRGMRRAGRGEARPRAGRARRRRRRPRRRRASGMATLMAGGRRRRLPVCRGSRHAAAENHRGGGPGHVRHQRDGAIALTRAVARHARAAPG